MAIQLSEKFREFDKQGESMIGTRVVKLFEGNKPFVGKITSYDRSKKWYRVVYEDGDSQDLTWRQLRVKAWKKIPREAVLWADEKHKRVVIGGASRHE